MIRFRSFAAPLFVAALVVACGIFLRPWGESKPSPRRSRSAPVEPPGNVSSDSVRPLQAPAPSTRRDPVDPTVLGEATSDKRTKREILESLGLEPNPQMLADLDGMPSEEFAAWETVKDAIYERLCNDQDGVKHYVAMLAGGPTTRESIEQYWVNMTDAEEPIEDSKVAEALQVAAGHANAIKDAINHATIAELAERERLWRQGGFYRNPFYDDRPREYHGDVEGVIRMGAFSEQGWLVAFYMTETTAPAVADAYQGVARAKKAMEAEIDAVLGF